MIPTYTIPTFITEVPRPVAYIYTNVIATPIIKLMTYTVLAYFYYY